MKLTLEFDAIEEKEEYENAINGTKYKAFIDDLRNWLRNKRKYEDAETVKIDDLETWIYGELG